MVHEVYEIEFFPFSLIKTNNYKKRKESSSEWVSLGRKPVEEAFGSTYQEF